MQEIKLVEIHRNDFLLSEVTLQFYCDNPFYRLLHQTFLCAMSP